MGKADCHDRHFNSPPLFFGAAPNGNFFDALEMQLYSRIFPDEVPGFAYPSAQTKRAALGVGLIYPLDLFPGSCQTSFKPDGEGFIGSSFPSTT